MPGKGFIKVQHLCNERDLYIFMNCSMVGSRNGQSFLQLAL